MFFWLETPQQGDRWSAHVFSNWFPSTFVASGAIYNCVEQFMMVAKASYFMRADPVTNGRIVAQLMASSDPRQIKALGRQVVGFDAAQWAKPGIEAVFAGNLEKFRQNAHLQRLLLATGDRPLVEASPYDKVWGIGLTAEQARRTPPAAWPGENRLGKVLMQVRATLRGT